MNNAARLTSHVATVEEFQTGGHCMVTLVTLADGRVLGINDECVVLYPSAEAFRDGHEGNDQYIDLLDQPPQDEVSTYAYRWRTDAAWGDIEATDPSDALRKLQEQREWAENPEAEARDIADGAWLTIFDPDGVPVLRRGTMP